MTFLSSPYVQDTRLREAVRLKLHRLAETELPHLSLATILPMPRTALLNEIAGRIDSIERAHPVRVGIDGPGAAGKTILADELADVLRSRGRHVIRAGVDGFHNPPAVRYRRGRDCVHGYYHDSFDYAAMREHLLDPLGPDRPTGSRMYRRAVYNFRVEAPAEDEPAHAPDDAVLLFEGVFIQRPQLAEHWDMTVYVHADFEVTQRRAMTREAEHFGSTEAVARKYEERYIPGQRLYLNACEPREAATIVVDNNDPARPVMICPADGLERRAVGRR